MGIARSEPEMQKSRSKEAWLIPYKTAKAACVSVQSSGSVWKSRWTSCDPVPNKPTVSVDVKRHFNQPHSSEFRSCVKVEVDVLCSCP